MLYDGDIDHCENYFKSILLRCNKQKYIVSGRFKYKPALP